MEKWVVAAKKADFNLIGRQFHIDPVIARLIRNRDVVGEEKIKEYVTEHNLQDRVQVNGAIFGTEMDRIIERAKVVLVPSEWYENGAFVALQALAKGKIVVASNIAGLAEIIQDGDTGFLAEAGNPDSFAAAIQKVLDMPDEQYKKMSEHIVEYAKMRCDAKKYVDKLISMYSELISLKKGYK